MITIKRVGIIIRKFNENEKEFIGTRYDLINILNKFNVNIITIPITISWNKIKNAITFCDGIILSGGSSFHKNDFKLVKYLYKNNIPTLGICLGMQAMAECFGRKKERQIENHYSNELKVHKIKIDRKTLLYKILKKDEIIVNSRHHTTFTNTNMLISSLSEDNIIESVELNNHKFFLGIQWHPESINDNNSYQLLKYFIKNL